MTMSDFSWKSKILCALKNVHQVRLLDKINIYKSLIQITK